ncbi:FAD binding domain-containing protein [soil metagenome]
MTPFHYTIARSAADAVSRMRDDTSRFIGGGTNLVDLMRQGVEAATDLVDVATLPGTIEAMADGSLRIGASVRNSTLASHPLVRARYPLLSRAVLSGASPQIRNMATVGGNVLQRTRCVYFYDPDGARCNKRVPGQGCDAREGHTRHHAILGASDHCVATHPSDLCVALAALDARVHIVGPAGSRTLALVDLHRLPGDRPDLDTVLDPHDLIEAVTLPPLTAAANSTYRKVRDRSSFAFALISVAAVLELKAGSIETIRLALGGVAAKPWRAFEAERLLQGARPTDANFRRAAEAELAGAIPLAGNAFKPSLAIRTIVAVLQSLAEASR